MNINNIKYLEIGYKSRALKMEERKNDLAAANKSGNKFLMQAAMVGINNVRREEKELIAKS